jgi:hypothetical protein
LCVAAINKKQIVVSTAMIITNRLSASHANRLEQ